VTEILGALADRPGSEDATGEHVERPSVILLPASSLITARRLHASRSEFTGEAAAASRLAVQKVVTEDVALDAAITAALEARVSASVDFEE